VAKMSKKWNILAKKIIKIFLLIFIVFLVSFSQTDKVYATTDTEGDIAAGEDTNTDLAGVNDAADDASLFGIDISTSGETGGISGALQIVVVLTVIALCPSILIMLTSFTRIIVVLHFTRNALNTMSSPPNQILIGLALFLTFFIMTPVFNDIYNNAYLPLSRNEITQEEALEEAIDPIKKFMLKNVGKQDLDTMCDIAKIKEVKDPAKDIPISVIIPSFIISELRIAFFIGFLIYVPFIVIDMVVSSVLMSMGMMMLPPTTISLPFKILLFVLADGWNLIIVNLVQTIKV